MDKKIDLVSFGVNPIAEALCFLVESLLTSSNCGTQVQVSKSTMLKPSDFNATSIENIDKENTMIIIADGEKVEDILEDDWNDDLLKRILSIRKAPCIYFQNDKNQERLTERLTHPFALLAKGNVKNPGMASRTITLNEILNIEAILGEWIENFVSCLSI